MLKFGCQKLLQHDKLMQWHCIIHTSLIYDLHVPVLLCTLEYLIFNNLIHLLIKMGLHFTFHICAITQFIYT